MKLAKYLCLGLCLWSCGQDSSLPGLLETQPKPAPPYETTLLVYMNGSNLETADSPNASENLRQMLAASTHPKVKVVICSGGSRQANPAAPIKNWRRVKRHLLEENEVRELEDLGPRSMDDPQTLVDFIQWGAQAYPARRYLMVMWDHGDGYRGYGGDDVNRAPSGASSMSQPELLQAFASSGVHFDMIGFDCCLMAAQEISHGLARQADFLLASEELEPGQGWNWTPLIEALSQQPDLPVPILGKVVCDAYLAQFTNFTSGVQSRVTLSLLDLRRESETGQLLERLISELNKSLLEDLENTMEGLVLARFDSYDFSNETVDLVEFARQLRRQGFGGEATTELETHLGRQVVYRVAGPLAQDSHGMAIFFPNTVLSRRLNAGYENVTYLPIYQQLVARVSEWAKNQVSSVVISQLNRQGDLLEGLIQSRFGVGQVELVFSPDPPTSPTIRVRESQLARQEASRQLAPLPIQILLERSELTWDGHPINVIPDRHQQSGNQRILNFLANVNGEEAEIHLLEDLSTGQVTLVDYLLLNQFDRLDSFRPTDQIEPIEPSIDRRSLRRDEIPSGQVFLAGNQQIRRVPLSGQLFLYLLVHDLRGGLFLSDQRIEL